MNAKQQIIECRDVTPRSSLEKLLPHKGVVAKLVRFVLKVRSISDFLRDLQGREIRLIHEEPWEVPDCWIKLREDLPTYALDSFYPGEGGVGSWNIISIHIRYTRTIHYHWGPPN